MTEKVRTNGILILGGSGGIGAAVARSCRARGWPIFLAARASDRLDALAGELDAPAATLDATQVAPVESALESAIEQLGGIGGVVNCVGSILLKPAHLTSPEEFRSTIETNLCIVGSPAK